MHTRDTKRWAMLTLVAAGLLGLAGCGDDTYVATTQLSGSNEVPPVTTSGSGVATATLDGDELTVTGTFSALSSDVLEVSGSEAHVHRGAAGTNGDIVFNLDVTTTDQRNGSFTGKRELSNDEQEDFKDGLFYVNVHTVNSPQGEVRGQLTPIKQD